MLAVVTYPPCRIVKYVNVAVSMISYNSELSIHGCINES